MSAPRRRSLLTKRGSKHRLPLFLPVHQPHRMEALRSAWDVGPEIQGCIVNSYFMYKERQVRDLLLEQGLHRYLEFDGLVTTDSGAFQGFTRKLFLDNRDIVRFQDRVGSDVLAPLDLVTPPGDNHATAEAKLEATNKRIRQAQPIVERGILAGVQQGGRHLDLRRRSSEFLMEIGADYIALGSLVPFFTRNHDLRFVCDVIRGAREIVGPDVPMHLYGAGDPLELPFLFAAGVTIFDSASYGHYALGGWYMTPYGAVQDMAALQDLDFSCDCTACVDGVPTEVPATEDLIRHNLWTILRVVEHLRELDESGGLDGHLAHLLEVHTALFASSALSDSWRVHQESS